MSLLDEILLGRRQENNKIRGLFSETAVQQSERVEQLTPEMLVTSKRKNDPATVAMATALYRTTGVLPESTGRGVGQIAAIPNEEIFQQMIDRGVRSGSTVAAVYAALGGQNVAGRNVVGNNALAGLFASLAGTNALSSPTGGETASQDETRRRTAQATANARPARSEAERLYGQVPTTSPVQLAYPDAYKPQGMDALGMLLRRYQDGGQ